jgi:hypothetical protein
MRIFVLDDDMQRIKWFKKNWENVYYAHDPVEAEKMLRANNYDSIWLDHDLGGAYERGPKGDGIDLAKVMAKEELQTSTPVVVHSLNYYGTENILMTLRNTHESLFKIDFVTLRKMEVDEISIIIKHKLKPFYRG